MSAADPQLFYLTTVIRDWDFSISNFDIHCKIAYKNFGWEIFRFFLIKNVTQLQKKFRFRIDMNGNKKQSLSYANQCLQEFAFEKFFAFDGNFFVFFVDITG